MPSAVVLGVNGQDGSYAAEALLAYGCQVTGIGRQSTSRYVPQGANFTYRALDIADTVALTALLACGCQVTGIGRQATSRYVPQGANFSYRALDIANAAALTDLLVKTDPDQIYHLAAIHGPNAPSYEPVWGQMMAVNVLSLHVLLEHARLRRPDCRIAYANSTKIFGPLPSRIDETTPRNGKCLYAITKNAAFDLIGHYRTKFGIAAFNLILSNHDSPRRPAGFFLTDLVACLAESLRDPAATRAFKSLDFWIDSGDAAEYMSIARTVLQTAQPTDMILASGTTWLGRDIVEQLFSLHGLDYRVHVIETAPASPGDRFQFDVSRLRSANNGDTPERTILGVAETMLAATLKRTGR